MVRKKESTAFRLLAASFGEEFDFGLRMTRIIFTDFLGVRATLRPDLGAEHFLNTVLTDPRAAGIEIIRNRRPAAPAARGGRIY